ncbi:MAG: DNA polymerase III subunit gamma/tau [Candidatus Enterosoma sp.]|nr:DNA polymerase III subunit gamma/tau [Candidatus Enterosoma sp.]
MSYLSFYNKYRPQSFSEVVGQKVIVKTLKNSLKNKKISHAYLFCGPRGTGKTTMARLFAKSLNCEEGIGNQCLKCSSCQKIKDGNHPDVVEIDAASNSTVDSVRNLIENISYQPILSRYKVYIIDEVHNMSNSAFNALLKTLEEPPSFVVFILATTEPQKILPTILSRVQRYDFSKVSNEDIFLNLKRVLDMEKIPYEDEALKEISYLADGGVRDSLSLLEQAVSYCDKKVNLKDIYSLFGILSKKEKLTFISAIEKKDSVKIVSFLKEKYQRGVDLLRFHQDILKILKDIYIYNLTNDENLLEVLNKEDIKDIQLSNGVLNHHINTLMTRFREYRYTDDVLTNCELSFLSLIKDEQIEFSPREKTVRQEEKNTVTKENKEELLSSPTLIEVSDKEEKKEKEKDEKRITADDSEIVNLMLRSKKEDRIEFNSLWDNLQKELRGKNKIIAASIYSSRLRLVDSQDKIILLSSSIKTEIEKLNPMSVQRKISSLLSSCFNREYNLLIISEEQFKRATELYKSGEYKESKRPNIVFDDNEKRASDEFVSSLFEE